MGMFGALDAASTGVALGRTWMDAISDNVANINTVRPGGQAPFRAKEVVAQSLPGTSGVTVAAIEEKSGTPQVVYDPQNPLADANGNVTRPVVDMSEEMTNMLVATRLYQANLNVMSQAKEVYQAALQIGKA
jgi:flagellar basal-body rod protein FlgC